MDIQVGLKPLNGRLVSVFKKKFFGFGNESKKGSVAGEKKIEKRGWEWMRWKRGENV